MTNPLITPEDLLDIADRSEDYPLKVAVHTFDRLVLLEVPEELVLEWANNRGYLFDYLDDKGGTPITLEYYMVYQFFDNECLDLAKFAVQYYPETIRSII